jgi:hypothetical protein
MFILQIVGGVFLGLLALGLLSVVGEVVDGVSNILTTGLNLRRNLRMQADWRILASPTAD